MPKCSNCGATDFVWASRVRSGLTGVGGLALRGRREGEIGTRICRGCGHADLFVRDLRLLQAPHLWKPGEFVPMVEKPEARRPPAVQAPAPVGPPAPSPWNPAPAPPAVPAPIPAPEAISQGPSTQPPLPRSEDAVQPETTPSGPTAPAEVRPAPNEPEVPTPEAAPSTTADATEPPGTKDEPTAGKRSTSRPRRESGSRTGGRRSSPKS